MSLGRVARPLTMFSHAALIKCTWRIGSNAQASHHLLSPRMQARVRSRPAAAAAARCACTAMPNASSRRAITHLDASRLQVAQRACGAQHCGSASHVALHRLNAAPRFEVVAARIKRQALVPPRVDVLIIAAARVCRKRTAAAGAHAAARHELQDALHARAGSCRRRSSSSACCALPAAHHGVRCGVGAAAYLAHERYLRALTQAVMVRGVARSLGQAAAAGCWICAAQASAPQGKRLVPADAEAAGNIASPCGGWAPLVCM